MQHSVWILTSAHNDYNQYGEYLEAVFFEKPTGKDLEEYVEQQYIEHVLNGGGRVKYEDMWWSLVEYKDEH